MSKLSFLQTVFIVSFLFALRTSLAAHPEMQICMTGYELDSMQAERAQPPEDYKGIQRSSRDNASAIVFGDTTDSDGDGMIDVAERKYGFDPNNAASFPQKPKLVNGQNVDIDTMGMDIWYRIFPNSGLEIAWHYSIDTAYMGTFTFGTDTLFKSSNPHLNSFAFSYAENGIAPGDSIKLDFAVIRMSDFTPIDTISFTLELPEVSQLVVGDARNRISFSLEGFSAEKQEIFESYLTRLFPLLYDRLGPPAEQFNCVIKNNSVNSSAFYTTDYGRTMITDGSFIPRLLAHELVHVWKGQYLMSSNAVWDYQPDLSGFEEALAEGMAFEIMHDYVQAYPHDYATKDLLSSLPYQYWSIHSGIYDAIRNDPITGAGMFWVGDHLENYRYSIGATTMQIMEAHNPGVSKKMLAGYFERINSDPYWRPSRERLISLFAEYCPKINGINTEDYLKNTPLFQGKKLESEFYILNSMTMYGTYAYQRIAATFVNMDGQAYWGIKKGSLIMSWIPSWVPWDAGGDSYNYINMQGQPFTVEVTNCDTLYSKASGKTTVEKRPDGTANSLGWVDLPGQQLNEYPLGLYKQVVTFTNFTEHTDKAKKEYYFFGYKGFTQDWNREYSLFVGIDGIVQGTVSTVVNNRNVSLPITNGAAVFTFSDLPFNYEGVIPITVTNSSGKSNTYYRTIIESGVYNNMHQHQYIIVDRNFNGIEDFIDDIPTGTQHESETEPSGRPRAGYHAVYHAASRSMHLKLNVEKSQNLSVGIYNLKGQELRRMNQTISSGVQSLQLSTEGLSRGMYLLRVKCDALERVQRFTVD